MNISSGTLLILTPAARRREVSHSRDVARLELGHVGGWREVLWCVRIDGQIACGSSTTSTTAGTTDSIQTVGVFHYVVCLSFLGLNFLNGAAPYSYRFPFVCGKVTSFIAWLHLKL